MPSLGTHWITAYQQRTAVKMVEALVQRSHCTYVLLASNFALGKNLTHTLEEVATLRADMVKGEGWSTTKITFSLA